MRANPPQLANSPRRVLLVVDFSNVSMTYHHLSVSDEKSSPNPSVRAQVAWLSRTILKELHRRVDVACSSEAKKLLKVRRLMGGRQDKPQGRLAEGIQFPVHPAPWKPKAKRPKAQEGDGDTDDDAE